MGAFGVSVFSRELIVLQLLSLVIMVVDYDDDVLGDRWRRVGCNTILRRSGWSHTHQTNRHKWLVLNALLAFLSNQPHTPLPEGQEDDDDKDGI